MLTCVYLAPGTSCFVYILRLIRLFRANKTIQCIVDAASLRITIVPDVAGCLDLSKSLIEGSGPDRLIS